MNSTTLRIVATALVALVAAVLMWAIFEWTVNRIYVPPGKSLQLRYKGPILFGSREKAKPGEFAEEGQIGVLERLRGPGRHFYCPIWWERNLVDDVVVAPGEVAIVTSKLGESLPPGEFLVDGDLGETKHKGILRKAYGPGRYRANPYAYEFKKITVEENSVGSQVKTAGWVDIPTGHVGVLTRKAADPLTKKPAGIQNEVLPPGLYPVNPHEAEVDVVEIGYRETSIHVTTKKGPDGKTAFDESGEPLPELNTGINFPSNDGFEIQMDFTAIWGIMPDQAAETVQKFGNIEAVEQKVIIPQSESICRNNGSKFGAVELLVGDTRLTFQNDTTEDFEAVLEDKGVSLLYGLIRHIYIPREIREPIQQSFIANELKLTRDQEQETAKIEGELREAEQKVKLETERVMVETEKMVASVKAEGDKEAKEIAAETKQLIAAIDRQAAELDAQKTVVLGEAGAQAEQLQQEAKAQKFSLAVEAFGTPHAFTQWQFAEGLPETINLEMIYAGEGTLWTDLKGVTPTVPLTEKKTEPAAKAQK